MNGVPVGPNHSRFNEKPLEDALKAVIREKLGDENALFSDNDIENPDFCPVFVTATEAQDGTGPVKLFKSYGIYRDQCSIWEVGRATSAAPSFFKKILIRIPAPGGYYIDGGLKCNNPSEVALQEAREYWETVRRFHIVSIGTGVQKTADFMGNRGLDDTDDEESRLAPINTEGSTQRWYGGSFRSAMANIPGVKSATRISRLPGGLRTLAGFAHELVKLSTQSETTHQKMFGVAHGPDLYNQFPYHRFNVPTGMDGISLEECRKTYKMAALTRGYLLDVQVQRDIQNCATQLCNPTAVQRT
jgi:hypothetical protein